MSNRFCSFPAYIPARLKVPVVDAALPMGLPEIRHEKATGSERTCGY